MVDCFCLEIEMLLMLAGWCAIVFWDINILLCYLLHEHEHGLYLLLNYKWKTC